MIEDSLKSLRNIHRLLITVSFVTLVFSMSIDAPKDLEEQRDLISDLLKVDFEAYLDFVNQKVEEFELQQLVPLAKTINDSLEADGHMIFGIDDIGNSFVKTAHVGRILVEDLVLSNVSDATLNQLDALNGISLGADVQLVMPEATELIEEVRFYLTSNAQVGQRVDNVIVGIIDFDWIAETFLPDSTTLVSLYFELPKTINTAGAPTFNASFEAEIIELEGTSFESWVLAMNKQELFGKNDGEMIWLPALEISTPGYREQKLGLLEKDLTDKITQSAPEKQKVSLLGTSIPGVLFVYASPLILIGLIYYLLNHTFHIQSLISGNENELRQFSWSPMTSKRIWKFDLLASVIILPMMSMVILYFQLSQFGSISLLPSIVLWLSFVGVLFLGRMIYKNIYAIREKLKVVGA